MLLERELARVQERPDLAARGIRQYGGPRAAEDEGDDLEEELRDVDRLRAEVEDLTEDGGEAGEAETCIRMVGCQDPSTSAQLLLWRAEIGGGDAPRKYMRKVWTGICGSSSSEMHRVAMSSAV